MVARLARLAINYNFALRDESGVTAGRVLFLRRRRRLSREKPICARQIKRSMSAGCTVIVIHLRFYTRKAERYENYVYTLVEQLLL